MGIKVKHCDKLADNIFDYFERSGTPEVFVTTRDGVIKTKKLATILGVDCEFCEQAFGVCSDDSFTKCVIRMVRFCASRNAVLAYVFLQIEKGESVKKAEIEKLKEKIRS